jgi:hypothetical protein
MSQTDARVRLVLGALVALLVLGWFITRDRAPAEPLAAVVSDLV